MTKKKRRKQKVQWKDILEYLENHEGISSMEAWDKFHITRLSGVIFQLRKMGYKIITVTRIGYNDYGMYRYAEYQLGGQ